MATHNYVECACVRRVIQAWQTQAGVQKQWMLLGPIFFFVGGRAEGRTSGGLPCPLNPDLSPALLHPPLTSLPGPFCCLRMLSAGSRKLLFTFWRNQSKSFPRYLCAAALNTRHTAPSTVGQHIYARLWRRNFESCPPFVSVGEGLISVLPQSLADSNSSPLLRRFMSCFMCVLF